jgi:hypothetical protein
LLIAGTHRSSAVIAFCWVCSGGLCPPETSTISVRRLRGVGTGVKYELGCRLPMISLVMPSVPNLKWLVGSA